MKSHYEYMTHRRYVLVGQSRRVYESDVDVRDYIGNIFAYCAARFVWRRPRTALILPDGHDYRCVLELA